MGTALSEINQHAGEVQRSSESVCCETMAGEQIVNNSVDAINKLAREISDSSAVIQRLEQNGEEIGKVIDVIRGIAEQTNLLALNTAIEAARAGDQGADLPWWPMRCAPWRNAPRIRPARFRA